ncbi:MAG: DUF3025 domain-containing protein [Gallionellaceae bacterium]|jgi:hypothetical protein
MQNPSQWNRDELLDSPFFEPLYPVLRQLDQHAFPTRHTLNTLLAGYGNITTLSDKPLHFVAQATGKLAFEAQYEPRCFLTGEVQTRDDNLHDLFNALVWLTFPHSKAAINALHYRALTHPDLPLQTQRGKVRDHATLLDESGVIVAYADPHLKELLCDFKWKELFWTQREQLKKSMGFYIFGHGLYEKAMHPYIGFTGQGLCIKVENEFFTWPLEKRLAHVDAKVAEYLDATNKIVLNQCITPVPLLGIPGWDNANRKEAYYENQHYFRPGRNKSSLY